MQDTQQTRDNLTHAMDTVIALSVLDYAKEIFYLKETSRLHMADLFSGCTSHNSTTAVFTLGDKMPEFTAETQAIVQSTMLSLTFGFGISLVFCIYLKIIVGKWAE